MIPNASRFYTTITRFINKEKFERVVDYEVENVIYIGSKNATRVEKQLIDFVKEDGWVFKETEYVTSVLIESETTHKKVRFSIGRKEKEN